MVLFLPKTKNSRWSHRLSNQNEEEINVRSEDKVNVNENLDTPIHHTDKVWALVYYTNFHSYTTI
jgi:hypothetical protein